MATSRHAGRRWLFAVLVAVVLMAPVAGTTAAADTPTSSTAQPDASSWQPPAVDMTALPADGPPGPGTGVTYTQKSGCITSHTNGVQLPDEPAAQAMLNIKTAQQFATGTGVTVAVIDTGVNKHPFLTDHNRLRGGGDYITPSATSDGTIDCDGHGTLTAGIVAANTANTGLAFTGVAPAATVIAIRQTSTLFTAQVGGQDTGLTAGTPGTLASAIVHAVNLGANVITTSVDTCLLTADAVTQMNHPGSQEKALQAAIHYAVEHNVVVVNSAGNTASQPEGNGQQSTASNNLCASVQQNNNPNPNNVQEIEIPAIYSDDLLSVASVSPYTGAVSTFSVWGPWVNIAAPGEGITSVDPGQGGAGLANLFAEPGSNSQPGLIQGTSFAAPYVAGVVALVRSRFPDLNARQVITRIEATAQHPSGPGGRNNQIGYGIINPVAALTAVIPGQNGVPAIHNTRIPAVLPLAATKDWVPVRVALIGTVGGIVLLLGTLFVVRTVRRRNPPSS
ncbi:MAG TPA: type VII secretion-associated serine protease mycosin [Pseudonocardiaceae bacterium]|nr:type VII secretion-associated serine protease mycosin [Pseudonocardiaceae bacterium]